MIDQAIRPGIASTSLLGKSGKGIRDPTLFESLDVVAIHVVVAIEDGHDAGLCQSPAS